MLRTFEYDDGTTASIEQDAHGVTIHVDTPSGNFSICGFPTENDAHNFLCWGDLNGEDEDIPPIRAFRGSLRWVPRLGA